MCGIAGIVSFEHDLTEDHARIGRMTDTLRHRGPDDSGLYLSDHALLGHRRLTVIDPKGGAQPMVRFAGGGQYAIVYNGELYNTEQLRSHLRELGFRFESYSDTEVLLNAYIAWGAGCVQHLNGIFAFAVWDERNRMLFMCRDPLGVKPLYYTQREGRFFFASELKALLTHPLIKPVIDEAGICEVMGLGPAHPPNSGVFKNIYQLPPAHWLRYSEDKLQLNEYWKLESLQHLEDEATTQAHVRELLLDAINRQLISDVPIATFLSGGLDSSIISAVAAKELASKGKRLTTFSVDYQDNAEFYQKNDFTPDADAPYAALMAKTLDTRHMIVELSQKSLVGSLADAMHACDMPGMADIDSSLLLFGRQVKKHATVALSGECADEIFGGYPWYLKPELATLDTFPWSNAITQRKQLLASGLGKIRLEDYVASQYSDTVAQVPREEDGSLDPMKKLFYLNIKWFMNTLLTRKDRMSMACGLEVRVPFADYRLVEYAFNIPSEYKFYAGREKGLLRKALEGFLPDEVLWRKKSPYPKTFSPEYLKRVTSWMQAIMADPNARILQMIDKKQLKALLDSGGESFGKPWFGQLMNGPQLIAYLIQLALWLERYEVEVSV